MKQTYEQRVQALAERMAANDKETAYAYSMYKKGGKIKRYYEKWEALSVCKKMEDARIVVAEMAQAVKAYVIQCSAIPAAPGYTVMDYLKEQGLIPEQEPDIEYGPNGSVHNPDNPEPDQKIYHNECPEFPHFGASYPDARCIDGYLWDLDSDNDGFFTHGGDVPCPFCNTEAYKEYLTGDYDTDEEREKIIKHIDFLNRKYLPDQEDGEDVL